MHIETHTHTLYNTHTDIYTFNLCTLCIYSHTFTCNIYAQCSYILYSYPYMHNYTQIHIHKMIPYTHKTYIHTPIHRYTVHILAVPKHSTHMRTHRNTDVHSIADILILHMNSYTFSYMYTLHTLAYIKPHTFTQ